MQCVFYEKVFKRTRVLEIHCERAHSRVNFPVKALKERFLHSVAIFQEFKQVYILDVLHLITFWSQARARSLAEKRLSSTRSPTMTCGGDDPSLNVHFELRHVYLTPGQLSAESDVAFGLFFTRLSLFFLQLRSYEISFEEESTASFWHPP